MEDGPEDSSNALVAAPFEEENEHTGAKRLKWIAQLEFAQTSEDHIARTDKLRELILEGIPHALRPQVRKLPDISTQVSKSHECAWGT